MLVFNSFCSAQAGVKEFFTIMDTSVVEWRTSPNKDTLYKLLAKIDTLPNTYLLVATKSGITTIQGTLYIKTSFVQQNKITYAFYDTKKKKYINGKTYIIAYIKEDGLLTYIDD